MSLSERSRSHLYTGLCSVIDDEEAVQEMLSHFPARDLDEPVTRDHLRAGMADLRAEMADLRGEMAELRADLRTEMATLDARVTVGLAALDQRMTEGFAAADRRVADQIEALRTSMRTWILGGLGLAVAATGTATAVVQALSG